MAFLTSHDPSDGGLLLACDLLRVSCTLRRPSSGNRAKNRNEGAVKHVRRVQVCPTVHVFVRETSSAVTRLAAMFVRKVMTR